MTEWLHFHFSLSCILEVNGNPLQCSCLENRRDGGSWWAAVYGGAQNRTRLKWLSSSSSSYTSGVCPWERRTSLKELAGLSQVKLGLGVWMFSSMWRKIRESRSAGEGRKNEVDTDVGQHLMVFATLFWESPVSSQKPTLGYCEIPVYSAWSSPLCWSPFRLSFCHLEPKGYYHTLEWCTAIRNCDEDYRNKGEKSFLT